MYTELHLILHSWNYITHNTIFCVLLNRLFDKCLLSQNSVLCVCNCYVNLSLANHGDYVPSIDLCILLYFFF